MNITRDRAINLGLAAFLITVISSVVVLTGCSGSYGEKEVEADTLLDHCGKAGDTNCPKAETVVTVSGKVEGAPRKAYPFDEDPRSKFGALNVGRLRHIPADAKYASVLCYIPTEDRENTEKLGKAAPSAHVAVRGPVVFDKFVPNTFVIFPCQIVRTGPAEREVD